MFIPWNDVYRNVQLWYYYISQLLFFGTAPLCRSQNCEFFKLKYQVVLAIRTNWQLVDGLVAVVLVEPPKKIGFLEKVVQNSMPGTCVYTWMVQYISFNYDQKNLICSVPPENRSARFTAFPVWAHPFVMVVIQDGIVIQTNLSVTFFFYMCWLQSERQAWSVLAKLCQFLYSLVLLPCLCIKLFWILLCNNFHTHTHKI